MKKIDRYLFANYLKPFFICAISFIGLFLFIDSSEKLRAFASYSKTIETGETSLISTYILGSIIVYFVNFMPYLIVIAVSIEFVMLNKTGQLMAMHSFGLPQHRIFRWPILFSICLGTLILISNFHFLPKLVDDVENISRTIRGLPNKNKAFIYDEPISMEDQISEQTKNIAHGVNFNKTLNPPVKQIVSFSEMIDGNAFKKILVTRLDADNQIRQRILLSNCIFNSGFISGASGIKQDYFSNGDLYREENLTQENAYFVKLHKTKDELNDFMSIYNSPNQTSMMTLFQNYHLKNARNEIVERLLTPIKFLLFILLALAISKYLDLKKIYMGFVVLIIVALLDVFSRAIPIVFLSNFSSILAIFISPILLFIIWKVINSRTA
jgi:lipopolysaccharide export LptBFGC system permease protein LptF